MNSKKDKTERKNQTSKFAKIKNIFPLFHSVNSRRKEVVCEKTKTGFKCKSKAPKDVWSCGDCENIPHKTILHPSLLDSEIMSFKNGPDCGVDYVESFFNKKKVEFDKIQFKHKQRGIFEKHYESLERKVGYFSFSLYERNPVTGRQSGEPIADSYLVCSRGNNSILIVADGVNWGRQAKIASRCAIYACYRHLEKRIFQQFRQDATNDKIFTTENVFKWLLESFEAAQSLIILSDTPGLTTLCAAVVLPLAADENGRVKDKHYAVCTLNIGDSLAFLLTRYYGIREITVGSHNSSVARDLRDTGGALGKVHSDNSPELNNLTFSLTLCDPGDIVLLSTDGVTDNFDPVVNKVAMPVTDVFPYIDNCTNGCDQMNGKCVCSCSTDNISCSAIEINFTGLMELLPEERQHYAMKQIERVWHDVELKCNGDFNTNGTPNKSNVYSSPSSYELCQGLMNEVFQVTSQKRKFLEKQFVKGNEENNSSVINDTNFTKSRRKLYAKSHSTAGADHENARQTVKLRHQKSLDNTIYGQLPGVTPPPVPPSLSLYPENLLLSSKQGLDNQSYYAPSFKQKKPAISSLLTNLHPGKLDHATAIASEIGDWHDFSSLNGFYYPMEYDSITSSPDGC